MGHGIRLVTAALIAERGVRCRHTSRHHRWRQRHHFAHVDRRAYGRIREQCIFFTLIILPLPELPQPVQPDNRSQVRVASCQ